MKNLYFLLITLLLFSCADKNPRAIIQTDLGDITLELYIKKAPITASNFLEHAKMGSYKNAMFYRIVNDENQPNNNVMIDVIQGGLFYDSIVDKIPAIKHETTEMTGLKHLDGSISMARLEPGSASTEFFICVGAQPELDYKGKRNPDQQGFAAFGRVIDGMEIVRQIHDLPDTDQYLNQFVIISNIKVED